MRIIGGSARGRRLLAPKSRAIRPTSDRVRESLFNVLGQSFDGTLSAEGAGSSTASKYSISSPDRARWRWKRSLAARAAQ